MNKKLHIDIETRSDVDLNKTGVYRYVDSPFFKIQLLAYAFDDAPVRVIDLELGETIPKRVVRAILNIKVQKWAHNAQFERVCLSKHLGFADYTYLDPTNWRDTAVYGATLGLPRRLGVMAQSLGSEQKDKEGLRLIRYFAVPCKPTKVNGMRTWNLPEHAPEDWGLYKKYNVQDVVAEREIDDILQDLYPDIPDIEWAYYEQDQRINDRGIPIDIKYVKQAIKRRDYLKEQATIKVRELTGVEKITQGKQLRIWCAEQGYPVSSLSKQAREDILNNDKVKEKFPKVYELIQYVEEAGGSSTSKYTAMLDIANKDGRIRGQIMFYGAGATGRYAGRGVQVQNLPRQGGDFARRIRTYRRHIEQGKPVAEAIIRQGVRCAIKDPDKFLAVSDYSQIEARILPWYADETWALEAFNEGKDIYVATAVQMYNVDYETAKAEWRQHGKTATLALGYGGAVGALEAMGAVRDGIPQAELLPLVKRWRSANPRIVEFWRTVENACRAVILNRGKKSASINGKIKITYNYKARLLQIWLPSGRALGYYDAHVKNKRILYLGGVKADGTLWHVDTFGGKLVENIVQATARDVLASALYRIEQNSDDPIIFHVHDEVIAEVDKGYDIETLNKLMVDPLPEWCEDLPLGSEGGVVRYYQKV